MAADKFSVNLNTCWALAFRRAACDFLSQFLNSSKQNTRLFEIDFRNDNCCRELVVDKVAPDGKLNVIRVSRKVYN